MSTERIIRNSAKCLKCGDEIESAHRHDFKSCKCGAISVDGGKDYIRRVWESSSGERADSVFEDTSITELV
jgi:tRNA(Ile2) C34 agmatinyltransferase TiaS